MSGITNVPLAVGLGVGALLSLSAAVYFSLRGKKHPSADKLASIAEAVLRGKKNNLFNAQKAEPGERLPYIINDYGGSGFGATSSELGDALAENIDRAINVEYSDWEFRLLVSHIESKYSEVASTGFRKFMQENPGRLIEILREVAYSGA